MMKVVGTERFQVLIIVLYFLPKKCGSPEVEPGRVFPQEALVLQ